MTSSPHNLRRSLSLVTTGVCLCMIYVTAVTSPAQTDFFRKLGAGKIYFGLLGGVPMLMLFMQFLGALVAARTDRRKPLFIITMVAGRLLYLPLAIMPVFFPESMRSTVLWMQLMLVALSAMLSNIAPPLWYTWMADLIPHRILNRYWGVRQQYMTLAWVVSYFLVALFVRAVHLPILVLYPVLVGIGVVAGVLDIILFVWVDEPASVPHPKTPWVSSLWEPLSHPEYRSFIIYSCIQSLFIMFGATFMLLYVLEHMGFTVWQVTLIWCLTGAGNGLWAARWGQLADRHGHRPVLIVCAFFKPVIVVVFLLLTPENVWWLLPISFVVDGAWNAGNNVASTGFMLKIAPRETRSTFVAALMGLTGVCGGLGSVLAGAFLDAYEGVTIPVMGREWTNYHMLFFVSIILRLLTVALVHRVKEPRTSSPIQVFQEFSGEWPIRMLMVPVGLYRRISSVVPGGR